MKVKEIYNGFQDFIELECETDTEREIFENKCGKTFLVQFVNESKIILREVQGDDEN